MSIVAVLPSGTVACPVNRLVSNLLCRILSPTRLDMFPLTEQIRCSGTRLGGPSRSHLFYLERCLLEALRDKGSVVEWCFSEMLLYPHLSCQLLDDSLPSPPCTPLFLSLAPGAGPDKLDIERVFRENYLALLLASFQGPQLGTLMSHLWVVEAWTIARRQPSSDDAAELQLQMIDAAHAEEGL
jgi:hypothetical protein